MERTSVKLSILVVALVAFATFITPFTAEARHRHEHHRKFHHRVRPKPCPVPPPPAPASAPNDGIPPYQIHGCGYPCSDSNDCDWPCTLCCANQTCCYDEPYIISDPYPSFAPVPSNEEPASAPALAPNTDDVEIPPYQIHDCGYPCSDSNDCDWPCTYCGANQTCSYEEPYVDPYTSYAPAMSVEEPIPAPALAPNTYDIEIPPYEIHGCGYPCSDSNDCDWPCTTCCANHTCCHEEPFIFPPLSSPAPAPAPQILSPLPSVEAPTPAPTDGIPPYQIHGCGYPCSDSNDCDAPCTICCANQTCCYDEPMFIPPISPSTPAATLPPFTPSQSPSPPPSTGDETDDDLLPTYPPNYDIGVPADFPSQGF